MIQSGVDSEGNPEVLESTRRVCFICEAIAGGVRKHIKQIICHLTEAPPKYEVSAILGDRGEPGLSKDIELFRSRGVDVVQVESFQREIGLRDFSAYRVLKRELHRLKPHVVHTHGSKAGFLGRLAARSCGVPTIIHTPHVFAFHWASGLTGRLYLGLERYAGKRCDLIVCVGHGQFEETKRAKVVQVEKIRVIPNGVRVSESLSAEELLKVKKELRLPEAAKVVGMVARLAPQKGVGTFLRAAREVVRKDAKVGFVLVGGGPMEVEVRRRAEHLGFTAEQFQVMGHVEGAERFYPAFDVVVLSSLYEGLPYVLLEAMAWGLPVIATDVMGSRDVIEDGRTGLLVDPGDYRGMADRILNLLEAPELKASLGTAAKAKVKAAYSEEQFLADHEALYAVR